MIVLDASRSCGATYERPLGRFDQARSVREQRLPSVPHLLDVEVVSALRNLVAGQRIDSHRSEQLLSGLTALPAERYPHTPLLERIWQFTAQLYRLRCRLHRLGRSKQLDLLHVRRKIAQRPSRSSETICITVREQILRVRLLPVMLSPGLPDNIASREPLRAAPPRWDGRNDALAMGTLSRRRSASSIS